MFRINGGYLEKKIPLRMKKEGITPFNFLHYSISGQGPWYVPPRHRCLNIPIRQIGPMIQCPCPANGLIWCRCFGGALYRK